MNYDYSELRKALNSFSDNGLYEAVECLPEEAKTDNLLQIQERISDLENAICIAISEIEGTL